MTGGEAKGRLKRVVRGAVAVAGPFARAREPVSRILTYHSVGSRKHEMNVAPEVFRRQMEWLAQHYAVIPLDAAARGTAGVAITFDDGYRDNLVHAAPVLDGLGLPATVFMVADRAGAVLSANDSYPVDGLLSWEELAELRGMGVQIGAHGMSHRRLRGLSEREQHFEIAESKRLIEHHLQCSVHAFAYPYGSALDYSEVTMALVRGAGYRYAVSNRYGANGIHANRWSLRRIWIDATDGLESFQAKVDGRLDLLRLADSRPGIRFRRLLNRVLGTQ